jgi:hypothetical protein
VKKVALQFGQLIKLPKEEKFAQSGHPGSKWFCSHRLSWMWRPLWHRCLLTLGHQSITHQTWQKSTIPPG